MLRPLNKAYPLNDDLRLNLRSVSGISLGVFLFLLFFLPLNPPVEDFNKKILILAGFGIIVLLLLLLLRIFLPSALPKLFNPAKWSVKKELLLHLIFIVTNSVAFSFFARFVGQIETTFHLTVNIILLSIGVVIAYVIINEYEFLKQRIRNLLNKDADEYPNESLNDTGIDFESENKSEHLYLFPEQIILIKAANNYIEIIYKQNEKVSRRLIRTTLKKSEEMLTKHPILIRCHRSFIVNKNCIQKINKSTDGLKILLFDYPQAINVSRQYVLKVKEALNIAP